jgi:hypothetical protein
VVEATGVARSDGHDPVSVVDWAPFLVAFIFGAAAGAIFAGRSAWVMAVSLPVAHFVLSIATGRAREGFLDYVVPVNLALLVIAVIGVLAGRRLRPRQLRPDTDVSGTDDVSSQIEGRSRRKGVSAVRREGRRRGGPPW